jgi:hypothetical protein
MSVCFHHWLRNVTAILNSLLYCDKSFHSGWKYLECEYELKPLLFYLELFALLLRVMFKTFVNIILGQCNRIKIVSLLTLSLLVQKYFCSVFTRHKNVISSFLVCSSWCRIWISCESHSLSGPVLLLTICNAFHLLYSCSRFAYAWV